MRGIPTTTPNTVNLPTPISELDAPLAMFCTFTCQPSLIEAGNMMQHCGVLNLDKPPGMTSRDVVDQVVRLVHPDKAGHAGTLDPLATGVLVVCVGQATRLISLVQEGRKRYRGRFVLGQRSDTDDITGRLTPGGEWSDLTVRDFESLLPEFVGRILQTPPQFSAVHVQGHRAYKLARRGEVVELAARPVDVFSLRLTDFQPPEFELEIECGSGTYIRSIGRDLGLRFGCGAVMKELRRLAVGSFDVADATSLGGLSHQNIKKVLQPAGKVASHFAQRQLTNEEVVAVRRGQSIMAGDRSTGTRFTDGAQSSDVRTALIGVDGQLMGIAEYDLTTHRLNPRIVFPAIGTAG